MEIEKMNKMLFSTTEDLLASLPEKERANAISFFSKKDILGNKVLSDDVLYQYNASLYIAKAIEQQEAIYQKQVALFDRQKKLFNELLDLLKEELTTAINHAVATLKSELENTVLTTNEQVGRLNITITNLVDNIFSYIDSSMSKMLVQIADEKTSSVNELGMFVDLGKEQLKGEIQKMIVELVQKELPEQLKLAVKKPIGNHLQHYTDTAYKLMADKITNMEKKVENMEKKVNAGHDPWSIMNLLSNVVVFSGVLLVFKLLHFI